MRHFVKMNDIACKKLSIYWYFNTEIDTENHVDVLKMLDCKS